MFFHSCQGILQEFLVVEPLVVDLLEAYVAKGRDDHLRAHPVCPNHFD